MKSMDKGAVMSFIVHSADISHPTKTWELHERWTAGLVEEFFRQGDAEKERGLPCSPLCDRETTQVSQSQIGLQGLRVEKFREMIERQISSNHETWSRRAQDD